MLYTMNECDFILSQLNHIDLTDWEENFVASIEAQRKAGKTLSDKQIETLSRIWDKQP